MDSTRGFLPAKDPLARLPSEFRAWDRLAAELPKLLTTTRIRSELAVLPKFPIAKLKTEAQLERAMMILSYLGHAYVWGEAVPTALLPANLAVPWHAVAKKLGRPPVLSTRRGSS
jgi:indoleamine 2,3-dioxygenase